MAQIYLKKHIQYDYPHLLYSILALEQYFTQQLFRSLSPVNNPTPICQYSKTQPEGLPVCPWSLV